MGWGGASWTGLSTHASPWLSSVHLISLFPVIIYKPGGGDEGKTKHGAFIADVLWGGEEGGKG